MPGLAESLTGLPASVQVVSTTSPLDSALHPAPSAVVLVITDLGNLSALAPQVKALTRSPLLAVVPPELLIHVPARAAVDDFVVASATIAEVIARLNRLISSHSDAAETVRRGDLAINTATCEVSLSGRLIELTFKEYTLLKFLAGNPGRVHTREVLLNKVWGYDYYGGDRTVDVHIRRLRSKIEDANHAFIDTVRNIGYRFRSDV